MWHVIEGFPPAGASLSAIVAARHGGFVIAGSAAAPSDACPSGRDARLWTSSDGVAWSEARLEDAANAAADLLVDGAPGLPAAVGTTGTPGCPGFGPVAWTAADGSEWKRSTATGLLAGDDVGDVVTVAEGQDLVASGRFADDEALMGIWQVRFEADGSRWRAATEPPPSLHGSTLRALASNGDVVVGFDGSRNPHVWYSADAGATWTGSDFTTSYRFLTTDSASGGSSGFVAAGRACCGLPDQEYGMVIRSDDGRAWTEARPGIDFARPIEALVNTPVGWIALGEETYVSSDGADWRLGPALPGFESKVHLVNRVPVPYRLAVAGDASQLVAITPERVWRASLADLAPGRWPASAPAAAMPAVGQSYEATLFTHCGPFNGPLYFDARSWVPDLPEGYFPLSFDSHYEPGTLAFVAEDRLEFTGTRGDVVTYLPTDDPPGRIPCA